MAKKQEEQKTEIENTILISLDVNEVKKQPRYLFESIALFQYVVLTDSDYQVMIKTDEISYVEISNETPYVIVNLRNGKSLEVGWGE